MMGGSVSDSCVPATDTPTADEHSDADEHCNSNGHPARNTNGHGDTDENVSGDTDGHAYARSVEDTYADGDADRIADGYGNENLGGYRDCGWEAEWRRRGRPHWRQGARSARASRHRTRAAGATAPHAASTVGRARCSCCSQ
jgi:hypothetical protein